MREHFADDKSIVLPGMDGNSRTEDWALVMREDLRTISVTRISMPLVMVISAAFLLLGVLSSLVWTASAKSTTLEQVINQQNQMQIDIKNLGVQQQQSNNGVVELKSQVQQMSKQLDTLTVQQENLNQEIVYQRQIRSGK